MKIIYIILVALAALFASTTTADAQKLKSLLKKVTGTETTTETTSETAATTDGKAAGAALKALYTQYKTDGKLNISNLTNIANITTLATNVKGLKGQTDKTAFYKDFAAGLITGSDNLVTEDTSGSIMSGLTSLANNVDLSNVKGLLTSTSSSSEDSQELTSTLSSILGLLK